MTETLITSAAEAEAVGARVIALLDAGDADGAIALADAAAGDDVLVTQLRAFAYTEGGRQKKDREATARGRELWESLSGRTRDGGYNLANAEQALFELAIGKLGYLGPEHQFAPGEIPARGRVDHVEAWAAGCGVPSPNKVRVAARVVELRGHRRLTSGSRRRALRTLYNRLRRSLGIEEAIAAGVRL